MVKELPVAFTEIVLRTLAITCQTSQVLHTAAATQVKVIADKTFARNTLLVPGKGSSFGLCCEFTKRCFQYISNSPFRLNEELTWKAISRMLDNQKTGALPTMRTYRVTA